MREDDWGGINAMLPFHSDESGTQRAAFYTIQTDGFTQCMLQAARFLMLTSKHLGQLEKSKIKM